VNQPTNLLAAKNNTKPTEDRNLLLRNCNSKELHIKKEP